MMTHMRSCAYVLFFFMFCNIEIALFEKACKLS